MSNPVKNAKPTGNARLKRVKPVEELGSFSFKVNEDGKMVYDIDLMCKQIDEYLVSREKGLPILKECCLTYGWDFYYLSELQKTQPKLALSVNKLIAAKEIKLELGGLSGKYVTAMSIFSLKQSAHGWRDKPREDEDNDNGKLLDLIFGLKK